MSLLTDITDGQRGLAGLVDRLARRMRPVSRRSVLVGTAVAASALATNPKAYALTPVTAYSTVCGPGNKPGDGWSVFCCTINDGKNACPPGSFTAGWWKAADSSWCGSGYRYYVDCNARCTCSSGCSDNMCDRGCWNCSCGHGSSKTCDQRLSCCNAFRYGQCNTQVACSGGVHCRVVSCVAPYNWSNCTTTTLTDNRTAEHSAPCIPKWGPIEAKYDRMGGPGSSLGVSTGPQRQVVDGSGAHVEYTKGAIYWSSATGAHALRPTELRLFLAEGGPRKVLGYPTTDRRGTKDGGWIQLFENGAITDSPRTQPHTVTDVRYRTWRSLGAQNGSLGYPTTNRRKTKDGGWIQLFENGAITDSPRTRTHAVTGIRYRTWRSLGAQNGVLGYPTADGRSASGGGWIQTFEHGAITDSPRTHTHTVTGIRYTTWRSHGGPGGVLGYPTADGASASGGGWIQTFEHGAITDSPKTRTQIVTGPWYAAWVSAGRDSGILGYPKAAARSVSRGSMQAFTGGELWRLGSGSVRRVYGGVLTRWKSAGGSSGKYGFPTGDTHKASDGRLTCTFENGTITVG